MHARRNFILILFSLIWPDEYWFLLLIIFRYFCFHFSLTPACSFLPHPFFFSVDSLRSLHLSMPSSTTSFQNLLTPPNSSSGDVSPRRFRKTPFSGSGGKSEHSPLGLGGLSLASPSPSTEGWCVSFVSKRGENYISAKLTFQLYPFWRLFFSATNCDTLWVNHFYVKNQVYFWSRNKMDENGRFWGAR